mmetsp:Transcript_32431/g.49620  ORF Transcript_32431/g.49620 Transcript_32431/m.49620 type:complete len:113 (-) Transcript_32431:42-380(-)
MMAPESLQLFPFKDDSGEEYQKKLRKHVAVIFKTLDEVISKWGSPENDRFLNELGARHSNYHVISAHFQLILAAFTEALRSLLGVKFTQEAEVAWKRAFDAIAFKMADGNLS